jgi:hypothetical protein
MFDLKMVLENFKSYGGEREVGPFHKRFSSIVGPNGSGKSNVIDAMLFVFGKKAKKLRLNKVRRPAAWLGRCLSSFFFFFFFFFLFPYPPATPSTAYIAAAAVTAAVIVVTAIGC